MTQYLHIDGKLIAEFHEQTWAEKVSRALDKWERSVGHLPHRDFLPERHIRLTDKHTGEEIFDNTTKAQEK